MRLTNNKLSEGVATALIEIANKYDVFCRDALFDFYTLFNNGTLNYDNAILEALRQQDPAGYYVERDSFFKQRTMLEDLIHTDIFNDIKTTYTDPLVCVEEFIKLIKAFVSQANATFNGTSNTVSNTANNAPINLDALCEAARAIINGATDPFMQTIFSSGGGFSYIISRDGEGKHDPVKMLQFTELFIKRGGAKLYSWVANLQGVAGFEKDDKCVTNSVTDDRVDEQMETLDQALLASPGDLVRPDVDKKLAQKELVVSRNVTSDKDKAHSIVLLDVSGSMQAADCAGGRMDRVYYATIITLAILDRVVKRGDTAHIILFEAFPLPPRSAESVEEGVAVAKWLISRNNCGGGTNTERAIKKAFDLINQAGKYRKCDIVLITDGECDVNETNIKNNKPEKTAIRTIQIGNSVSVRAKNKVFEISDKAIAAGWDFKNDCPDLGTTLQGV